MQRNLSIAVIICSLFAVGFVVQDQDKETQAAPTFAADNSNLLEKIESLEAQLAELQGAAEAASVASDVDELQRYVYYKRQWQKTGRWGRGRWVNVPYYSYASSNSSAAECSTSSSS